MVEFSTSCQPFGQYLNGKLKTFRLSYDRKQDEMMKCSKGQELNLGCCSKDKTSVDRTPALPTELNISQSALFLTVPLLP